MARRHKLVALALLPFVGLGGWLLLRGSALFAVDQVTIVGLSPGALPAVSDELIAAARTQTTTDFSVGVLRAAVARYTLIDSISVQTHFPHGVRIVVSERSPLARLDVAHHAYTLAADGTVITGLADGAPLAIVHSTQRPRDGRSSDPNVALALALLSDAPLPLRLRAAAVSTAHGTLSVYLHRGPQLIFGSYALPHAKWDAAAAVLADPSSRGATYIDLRVPSRPAAQVGDPATEGSAATTAGAPSSATTVATLLQPSALRASTSTSG
jgi:cell division septal protein FtsQ